MNIAILGAGAWGTALAIALSARHTVALWVRDPVQARALEGSRCNARYLPEVALPGSVGVTASLGTVLERAALALVVTPTGGLRETLTALRGARPGLPLLWACKGFERSSAQLPHEIAAGAHNRHYLETKARRSGHLLSLADEPRGEAE